MSYVTDLITPNGTYTGHLNEHKDFDGMGDIDTYKR